MRQKTEDADRHRRDSSGEVLEQKQQVKAERDSTLSAPVRNRPFSGSKWPSELSQNSRGTKENGLAPLLEKVLPSQVVGHTLMFCPKCKDNYQIPRVRWLSIWHLVKKKGVQPTWYKSNKVTEESGPPSAVPHGSSHQGTQGHSAGNSLRWQPLDTAGEKACVVAMRESRTVSSEHWCSSHNPSGMGREIRRIQLYSAAAIQ
ncbi:hypothetical protein H920_10682 [Fukomys damarensis]|uniref:Uncharacterized protein n=1 Tax=Fukomys damarensis TaxID=885580 RepID=A0A091DBP2_FUKDA|nr:hypothetical protein H920_10682 [Fukomys damarensis]